eukprot:GHVL01023480.1.p1 GENE.GHVL01023480.1~~GHVL01023480.1.p1  ORF type:complete len:543 (+),score=33.57 GHVL01023480.1:2-1630(+)
MRTSSRLTAVLVIFAVALCLCQAKLNRTEFAKGLAKKWAERAENRTSFAKADLAQQKAERAETRASFAKDLAQKWAQRAENGTGFAKNIAKKLSQRKENRTAIAKGFAKKWVLTAEKRDKVAALWEKYGPDYSAFEKTAADYPCGPLPRSASVPTSVHDLRPGDIKVVGALGDSLTAGSGITATNIFAVLTQNRGLSWSGGGETDYTDQITLPNILKKYNPDVYGFATGNGDEDSKSSIFNVAVSGSTSSDLVNQARELIDRMKADPKVDFANDWKVVTILSGNNDLCDYCSEPDTLNAEKFYANTVAALDILHAELPRTLVNLVEPLNMEIVTELNKGLICSALHFFLCDCAAFPKNDEKEQELIAEADMFQKAVERIAVSGRYDTTEDFTVVYQPFFNATYLPRIEDGQPDLSYFSPDCFHLSRKGQAAAASALWNNMIERVDTKRIAWTPGETIECPTEAEPYFFTNKNSDRLTQNFLQQQQHAPQQATGDVGSSSSSAVAVVVGVAALAVVAVVVVVVYRRKRRRNSYAAISSSSLLG